MSRTSRILWSLLLCCGLALAQGCGDDGDGDGGGTDTGTDAGNDTGNDAGNDTGNDGTGGSCGEATECNGNADCSANEFCSEGCCEERPQAQTCTIAGATCQDATWSTANFICDQPAAGEAGVCLARCLSIADPGDSDACSAGSYCIELDNEALWVERTDGSILDGACLEGDCNDVGSDGDYSCDDGAGTCYAFPNNANFCITAGTQAEGDSCIPGASEDAAEVCAAGLLCYQGTCVDPCMNNSECEGDTECVAVFDHAGSNRPGACVATCDPYSDGQCPEGQVCDAALGAYITQVNAWACRPLDDGVTVAGEGEDCDPDGEDSQCGEGLDCVIDSETDEVGTCVAQCDPTGEYLTPYGGCAVGTGATLGEGTTAAGEGSDWATAEAATYPGASLVDEDGDEVLALDGFTLAEGGSYSAVAYLDADGDAGAEVYADDTVSEVESGESLLQVYNTTPTVLDVYSLVLFSENISVGEEVTETGMDPAADYQTFDGEAYTFLGREASEGGETYNVIIHGIADDEDTPVAALWLAYEAPSFEAESGAVRVVHAVAGGEAVYIDGDLAYGEVSDWFAAPAGAYELDVLDGEGGTSLMTIEVEVTADTAYTVVVYDDGDEPTYLTLTEDLEADSDEEIAIRALNVSDGALGYAIGEPLLTGVGTTSSVVIDPAELGLIYGDSEAEAGDTALATQGATVAADELHGIVVGWDDSDPSELTAWSFGADIPDTGDLAEGEAQIRILHAALGAPAVQLATPGAPSEVCFELSIDGYGRCLPICTPYGEGDWETEDGELNGRWESNGCPHTDDTSYGCIAADAPGFEFGCDVSPPGACLPRDASTATGVEGDSCEGDAQCGPELFCVNFGDGGECTKTCFPNALESDCGEGSVCVASLATTYYFCTDVELPDLHIGDACDASQAGRTCADDNSFCGQTSATEYECIATCTRGCIGLCPGDTATRSACTAAINPALDPPDEIALCQ